MTEIIDEITGEIYDVSTDEKAIDVLIAVQKQIKILDKVQKHIKELLRESDGVEHSNHKVRVMSVQRSNYNKASLRQHLDDDVLDLFTEVKKGKLDKWLAEQVKEGTGYDTTAIRSCLEPSGDAYEVIKLERISRNDS